MLHVPDEFCRNAGTTEDLRNEKLSICAPVQDAGLSKGDLVEFIGVEPTPGPAQKTN